MRGASVLALLCGALFSAGCEAFDPCPATKDKQENVGQLDEFWNAEGVQLQVGGVFGLPFPPRNLPGASVSPKLREGDLRFLTTNTLSGGSCTDVRVSYGIVTAHYEYEAITGEIQRDWQGGTFEYDHDTKVVTLRAYGREVTGTVIEAGDDIVMKIDVDAAAFKKDYAFLGSLKVIFSKSPF
jgi:hypothetical protein